MDVYSKIAVLRLVKGDKEETISVKKYIYLSTVISYEDGASTGLFDWDGGVIYVVCDMESFYMAGDVDEFDKEMNKFITAMRKQME
jgi:hypothetical protein